MDKSTVDKQVEKVYCKYIKSNKLQGDQSEIPANTSGILNISSILNLFGRCSSTVSQINLEFISATGEPAYKEGCQGKPEQRR
ncbi:MAG: hypothetical protein K5744_03525 [Eubacterium sp.]|nr:hypothetical protein [Eubacterium sp.]